VAMDPFLIISAKDISFVRIEIEVEVEVEVRIGTIPAIFYIWVDI
jgi:hypothetical protein